MTIESLLMRNEDNTLEFKESTRSLANILKTIVAFANTTGGTIVIGVEDTTKKVVGVPNVLTEEERLVNAIADSIAPFFIPNLEIQTYRKKELILIHVPFAIGPHYLKAEGPDRGVYIRLGSTSRAADADTVATLRSLAKNVFFDELPHLQDHPDMLDLGAMEKIFTAAGKSLTPHKLKSLGVVVEHMGKRYSSNGGIILFGTNRSLVFPDAIVRCVRFVGHARSRAFDHGDIDVYLPRAVDEIIHFIEKNTMKRAEIKSARRTDISDYPKAAVREAVINALVHTDYAIRGSSIMVAIFDDRLEITNPGGVPYGITLEEALAGSSRVRNRVIAKVFRELKLIEQWGSGLERIIEACVEQGLKKPLFQELGNQFRVTLYSEKTTTSVLKPEEQVLVDYIKKKGSISTKEAASFWRITPRNARVRLKQLLEQGVIYKIGTAPKDPYGKYVVKGNK